MAINISLLNDKIRQAKLSREALASEIGMFPSTYYRKLSGASKGFSQQEIVKVKRVLHLTDEETAEIFLR